MSHIDLQGLKILAVTQNARYRFIWYTDDRSISFIFLFYF